MGGQGDAGPGGMERLAGWGELAGQVGLGGGGAVVRVWPGGGGGRQPQVRGGWRARVGGWVSHCMGRL